MFRTAVALAATASMCAAMPPAMGDPPPTGARATMAPMVKAKRQTAKVQAPAALKEAGTTVLLPKPTYTNAGKRVRVTVSTQTRHGKKTTKQDVRVLRKGGKVTLTTTGRTWIKAQVTYRAAKAPGYAAYSRTRTYKSWKKQAAADLQMTGANMMGVEWKDFFSGLLSSVAEDVTGSGAIGWAVGFLFTLGEDPKPDPLEEVKKQLEQINAKLDEINRKIDELSLQSAFQTCSVLTSLGKQAISTINTQANTFREYSDAKDPNRDRKDWLEWAAKVLDEPNGSLDRLEYLKLHLPGDQGAIQQCGAAFLKRWQQQYAPLDEAKYYQDLWTYLNYFYQAQILGLNNVVEAYHIRAEDAWMNGGGTRRPLPSPKNLKTICNSTSSGRLGASPSQNCQYAKKAASRVYYSMLDQARSAGAAYAWNVDGKNALAMQVDTPWLWVTDLNKYGSRSRCDGPVDSRIPCGPTVGRAEGLSVTSALGYDRWDIARANQWRPLLGRKNVSDTSAAMVRAGFPESMKRNLIVYTGETVNHDSTQMRWASGENRQSWDPLMGDWKAYCMFDTNLGRSGDGRDTWLYCQDDAAFWFLANRLETVNQCFAAYHYRKSDTARDGTSSSFYDLDFVGTRDSGCNGGDPDYSWPEVIKAPGWLFRPPGNGVDGTAQFRWPVQDVSKRQCLTNLNWGTDKLALQPRNVSGAWSMCGDDYRAWLKTQLPDPPK